MRLALLLGSPWLATAATVMILSLHQFLRLSGLVACMAFIAFIAAPLLSIWLLVRLQDNRMPPEEDTALADPNACWNLLILANGVCFIACILIGAGMLALAAR